ncbi:hypothetical protein AGENTSMITH_174 [Bacillus phage vB_BspM_AgentSmith]|nr:hypothetical protein AGENTSMITH_174 [Bacillus phage vB_BspM_AgentSmith]
MTMLVVNTKSDNHGNKKVLVHDSATGHLYEVEYLSTGGASVKVLNTTDTGVVNKKAVDLSTEEAKKLFSSVKGMNVTNTILKEHLIVYTLVESKPRSSGSGVLA